MKLSPQSRAGAFVELFPPRPKYIAQPKCPRGAKIGWAVLRKLLAFSGLGLFGCSRLHGYRELATDRGVAQFYYTLLSLVIISSLMAIFLTN